MKKLFISIITFFLTFASRADHIRLFVLTGQSNSLGTTAGGEADPSPGSDPADDAIKFFWHNVADASTSLGDSGGVFTTLQEQQGGYYADSATHWGPEIGFARTLYRAGVRNFGVIKAARGEVPAAGPGAPRMRRTTMRITTSASTVPPSQT